MSLPEEITGRIKQLEEKYKSIGQDMNAYLDGLLTSNVTSYWEYINVDTLLTLQHPKTDFPDELIFIMYHQITELYFKLAIHELEQIGHNGRNVHPSGEDRGWNEKLDAGYFTRRITRVNRYFEALTKSFDIMVDGMEKEQFLRFRMALLPASGFQSAQYRMIEIMSTDFIRLVDKDVRHEYEGKKPTLDDIFKFIYWTKGATDNESGAKTLTLKKFEDKYSAKFLALAKEYADKNMWAKYKALPEEDQNNPELIRALRQLDINVNVNWPLVHYKSAVRYLAMEKSDVPATGGTNWQKYLPPRFQKRIFYPELWTQEEMEEWGKAWVENVALK